MVWLTLLWISRLLVFSLTLLPSCTVYALGAVKDENSIPEAQNSLFDLGSLFIIMFIETRHPRIPISTSTVKQSFYADIVQLFFYTPIIPFSAFSACTNFLFLFNFSLCSPTPTHCFSACYIILL